MHLYKNWWCKGWKRDWKNHVSDVKGTLGIYVLNKSYSFLNALSSMSTASVIFTISLSKQIFSTNLWIWISCFAYKLPLTTMDFLCIVVIIVLLSIVAKKKTFYCNDENISVCDINITKGSSTCVWSEFITRTLRMEYILSHVAGTFCPYH